MSVEGLYETTCPECAVEGKRTVTGRCSVPSSRKCQRHVQTDKNEIAALEISAGARPVPSGWGALFKSFTFWGVAALFLAIAVMCFIGSIWWIWGLSHAHI